MPSITGSGSHGQICGVQKNILSDWVNKKDCTWLFILQSIKKTVSCNSQTLVHSNRPNWEEKLPWFIEIWVCCFSRSLSGLFLLFLIFDGQRHVYILQAASIHSKLQVPNTQFKGVHYTKCFSSKSFDRLLVHASSDYYPTWRLQPMKSWKV